MTIIPFPVCTYAAIHYKMEDEQYQSSSISIMDCGKLTNRKWNYLTCGPTSCYMCQLLTDLQRVRRSLPFDGQLTTDIYDRKLAHMLNNSISCLCICRNPLYKWKTTSTNRKWNYDDNSIFCLLLLLLFQLLLMSYKAFDDLKFCLQTDIQIYRYTDTRRCLQRQMPLQFQ